MHSRLSWVKVRTTGESQDLVFPWFQYCFVFLLISSVSARNTRVLGHLKKQSFANQRQEFVFTSVSLLQSIASRLPVHRLKKHFFTFRHMCVLWDLPATLKHNTLLFTPEKAKLDTWTGLQALQRPHWTVSSGVWLAWMYLKSVLCSNRGLLSRASQSSFYFSHSNLWGTAWFSSLSRLCDYSISSPWAERPK